MGGVGVDLLLLLVVIFRASCIEDVDFPFVACKDVTGHVGKELTLKCTVIYSKRCHAVLYKFMNTDKDTTICRERFTSKSNQKHFTCSYAPNEDMTSTFLFFLQADCGIVKKYFTVNTAGGSGRIQGDPTKETSVLTDFPFVACKDVTGHVGKELTLDCTVIYSKRCHAVLYKFMNTDKDTTICRERFTSKSNQKHFTCSYTPNEDMTSTFLFFLQADCGIVKKYFTVNTAGGSGRIQGDPTEETSVLTDFSFVACKDVTGHVGKELTLDCTVIYSKRCHAVLYKFINKDTNTTICRERFTSKSNQKHFTCSYAPNEDMTSTFLFFLQADCGIVKKYFTVNTAGGSGRIQGDHTKETSVLTDFPFVACKDVTGHVGKELTLDCTVIYSKRCHAVLYKFMNTDKDTTICRERFIGKSNQKHFTCSYAPNEDMTSTFLFFLQADCGIVKKYFTVNTAGGSGRIQGDPTKETSVLTGKPEIAIIMAGISCFIIFVVGFVLVRKHNTKNSFGFLKNYVVLNDKIKNPQIKKQCDGSITNHNTTQ